MYPAPVRHPSAGVSEMQTVKTYPHTLNLNTYPSTASHTPTPSNLSFAYVQNLFLKHFCKTLNFYYIQISCLFLYFMFL